MAEVVAERRNVQEKCTGRGAASRRFVQKIGESTFFWGRYNTGEEVRLSLVGVLSFIVLHFRFSQEQRLLGGRGTIMQAIVYDIVPHSRILPQKKY